MQKKKNKYIIFFDVIHEVFTMDKRNNKTSLFIHGYGRFGSICLLIVTET